MSSTIAPDSEAGGGVDTESLRNWLAALPTLRPDVDDAERIDQLRLLEHLKSVCAAMQARVTEHFITSQTTELREQKVKAADARRSIGAQVALARQDAPARGGRHVGMATALVREMRHTLAALQAGQISEWRATLVVRETAGLSREHREQVDSELAGTLTEHGDARTAHAARMIAYRLDPQAVVNRARKAEQDRRVSVRPAPDAMAYLSALLPVAQAVACYAGLVRHADTHPHADRARGAVMADELIRRLITPGAQIVADPSEAAPGEPSVAADSAETPPRETTDARPTPTPADAGSAPSGKPDTAETLGTTTESVVPETDIAATREAPDRALDVEMAEDPADPETTSRPGPAPSGAPTPTHTSPPAQPTGLTIDLHLVMTDRTLLDGDDAPAHLVGYGPIPAPLARRIVLAPDAVRVWIRRLYTDPITGQRTTADQRRRLFPRHLRDLLVARDQTCRTPWCDAPIRHADHVIPHAAGGPTTLANGQGLCERCNHTKQAPGWTARPGENGTVNTTTPTGHHYRSDTPQPPGSQPWIIDTGHTAEHRLADIIWLHAASG